MELNSAQNYQLLNGINEATSILLEEEDTQKAFKSALRIIGVAIEVDRVYIFRNHKNEKKEILVSQICEWTKDSVSQQLYNPELQNFSYFKNGFARWWETLSKGKTIKGKVNDFPEQERMVLKEQNILSLIVVPVVVQKKFWGFVGFDDCTIEREWEELEEATLFNFAHSIGGILSREMNRQNLLDNQKFIQSVIDTSPNIIYVSDHQAKKVIYLSKQITDIIGYKISEIQRMGERVIDLIHPDDLDQIHNFSKEIESAQDGVIYELVFRIKNKAGSWIWVSNKNTVYKRDSNGDVKQTVGVTEDITVKKESEDKVRESLQLLASINHNIGEGIFRTTLDGQIVYANKACLDIFGFATYEELAERNINQFYSYESDREKYKNLVINKGGIRNHKVKAVKKDGSPVWVLGSSVMVTDNEGNTCFDTAIRDITEEVIADENKSGGLDI